MAPRGCLTALSIGAAPGAESTGRTLKSETQSIRQVQQVLAWFSCRLALLAPAFFVPAMTSRGRPRVRAASARSPPRVLTRGVDKTMSRGFVRLSEAAPMTPDNRCNGQDWVKDGRRMKETSPRRCAGHNIGHNTRGVQVCPLTRDNARIFRLWGGSEAENLLVDLCPYHALCCTSSAHGTGQAPVLAARRARGQSRVTFQFGSFVWLPCMSAGVCSTVRKFTTGRRPSAFTSRTM